MKTVIKKVPLPISGVALGLAALGNLIQSYSEVARSVCGVLAFLCLLLLAVRILVVPGSLVKELEEPVPAGVSATFPMAMTLLSVYLKPFVGGGAVIIWYLALVMHACLILYVTFHFVIKFSLTNMVPSFFIVYAGIVVGSVTAPAYGQQGLGNILFWTGFIPYLLMLCLVTYRYIKLPKLPAPAKPLLCIYTAPMSLCVAGYVQSVTPKSVQFLTILFTAAMCLYVFALLWSIRCWCLPFYPSHASFTFPFVISAIAVKMTMTAMTKLGQPWPWLQPISSIMTVIAIGWTLATFVLFMVFLTAPTVKK